MGFASRWASFEIKTQITKTSLLTVWKKRSWASFRHGFFSRLLLQSQEGVGGLFSSFRDGLLFESKPSKFKGVVKMLFPTYLLT